MSPTSRRADVSADVVIGSAGADYIAARSAWIKAKRALAHAENLSSIARANAQRVHDNAARRVTATRRSLDEAIDDSVDT